jgi:hypothetical protein
MAKDLNILYFRGVFSKDKLKDIKNPQLGNYIINLENSVDKKGKPLDGTHWLGLKIFSNGVFYFDSFGVIYPNEIYDFCKRLLPNMSIHYNKIDYQNLNSTCCGQFVIHFLKYGYDYLNKNYKNSFFNDKLVLNNFNIYDNKMPARTKKHTTRSHKPQSAWMKHLLEYKNTHHCTLREAMMRAKLTYRK